VHDWLLRLTRPEDHLVWTWVAIAAAYAGLSVVLGVRARRTSRWDRGAWPAGLPGPRSAPLHPPRPSA